jgi:Glycosyl transferase family 2
MAKRDKLHLMAKPKLRLIQGPLWPEHREGWTYVQRILAEELCCDDGIAFVSSIEERLYNEGPITEPWVGMVHQVPVHDLPRYPDLTRLLQRDDWQASMKHCLGLWTLCDYNRVFLEQAGVNVPIGVLPYVTPLDRPKFDWDTFQSSPRRLLHVGQYLRNFQTFYDLKLTGWEKLLLTPPKWGLRSEGLAINDSVTLLDRVDDESYDRLLAESVVALDIRDAGATTTIVECMARTTPICINNVGAVGEYLGVNYPLYHDGNISDVLQDDERIRAAHEYLAEKRETMPSAQDFVEHVQSSAVYMSLPLPKSQQIMFPQFELTVLIAVFARLHSLREQLERLAAQDNPPTFELILWNNKPENAAEVARICLDFRQFFPIRVIDCSDNIYCAMRMAVPAFARAATLLFCDDDVLPEPGYLRRMYEAHQRLGARSAVCVRGHVIHGHSLNTDNPESAWVTEEHMTFFDQEAPECIVDFAHADNFVIAAAVLREASTIPMTHPEYVLVDDYWLSYVLNRHLGVAIHKLQAPDILSFTPSADDEGVALYHNPHVHEQRVRLYIEHMRAGWPARPSRN